MLRDRNHRIAADPKDYVNTSERANNNPNLLSKKPGPHESLACTVVICTRNRPALLERCLRQLQKQDFRSFEVLVVDNCPAPSEACGIAALLGARYILCPTIGLSHARNTGMRACRTEFVAFLDDDAVPEPEWLLKLLGQFSSPQVAAVTGQVIMESQYDSKTLYPNECLCVDKSTPYWFEMANFGGLGNGSNMAFRRSALEFWPGFDECLGRGQLLNAWEDDYAFFTLVHQGYSIVYAPSAQVHHPFPSTNGGLLGSLHSIAVSGAYITLLAFKHPAYIPQIYRFLLNAARRSPRAWRSRPRRAFDCGAPSYLIYSALLAGPFIYFFMRLTRISRVRRWIYSFHNQRGKAHTVSANELTRSDPDVATEREA